MLRLPRREDVATVVSRSVDANVPKREGRREKENAEMLRMQTGPDSIATLFVSFNVRAKALAWPRQHM